MFISKVPAWIIGLLRFARNDTALDLIPANRPPDFIRLTVIARRTAPAVRRSNPISPPETLLIALRVNQRNLREAKTPDLQDVFIQPLPGF